MMKKIFYITVLNFICIIIAGCGNVTVTGKVVFEDGSPLSVGQIRMVGANGLAHAGLSKNGTFSVKSVSGKNGIPPGIYKVAIEGAMLPGKSLSNDEFLGPFTAPTPLIAQKYADPETSGIVFDTTKKRKLIIVVEKP
jgi:lipid-binding SYLF domain-containing protein